MTEKNILELLKNVDVQWKTLGEVAEFQRGQTITKKSATDGDIPVVAGGREPAYYHNESNRQGTIITVAGSGAYAGFVSYWTKPIFLSDAFSVEPDENLDVRYLYHWLLNQQERIYNLKQGSGIPHVYGKDLAKFEIPIPPLSVQKEIVQILDKMTEIVQELTAELTAELTLRQKQYSYYRDLLLSEDYLNKLSAELDNVGGANDKVEWTTLGEVGAVRMCKRILKNQTSNDGDVPFYKIGTFGKTPDAFISKELFGEYKERFSYPKVGDILISASGTIGRTVRFSGEDSYFQDSNIVWVEHDESKVTNDYLYYLYQVFKWKSQDGGTISRLYNRDLENQKLAIPSLKLQSKVVEILDKFQAMTEDVSGLLPEEIEQRQKQYTYYRDQLLSFSTAVNTDSSTHTHTHTHTHG